jgi:hypothetical protein
MITTTQAASASSGVGPLITPETVQLAIASRMAVDRVSHFVESIGFFSRGVIGASAKYPVGHRPRKLQKGGQGGDSSSRRSQRGAADSITIYNDPYDTELDFPISDLRRNPAYVMSQFASLGILGALHAFELCLDVITDNPTAFDGKTLFNATHKIGKSATITNELTETQVPELAITLKTKPTPEEAALAVLGVIGYMEALTDESKLRPNEGATKWAVLYPAAKKGPFAAGLFGNNLSAGVAVNALAAMQRQDLPNMPDFEILPISTGRLTNTLQFVVAQIDDTSGTKPILLQEEEPFRVDVLGEGSEFAKREQRVWAGAKWDGGAGPGDFVKIARATFSTAS